MNEKKVIGYVGTRNLGQMREEDIRKLDVINIAFGRKARERRRIWSASAGSIRKSKSSFPSEAGARTASRRRP